MAKEKLDRKLRLKLSKEIRKKRKVKGFTQEKLAEQVGVCDRWIIAIEGGRNMPNAVLLLRLCAFLGIDLNEYTEYVKNFEEERDLQLH